MLSLEKIRKLAQIELFLNMKNYGNILQGKGVVKQNSLREIET